MAKAGKPRINLPDAWFAKAEEELEPQLESKAQQIAKSITRYKTGVLMTKDRNGRPVAMIALQEPHGVAIQAKTGELTRAAASAGVDVHRYRRG